jgi:hypothetical protein
VLELRHVLLGRGFLRERPRQHELGFKNRTGRLHHAIERRRHPLDYRVLDLSLNVLDDLPGILLIPAAIEGLSHYPELDDQIVDEVFRLDLAPFFPPQADQRAFVSAHDDAGVRATDEMATVAISPCVHT